MLRPRTSLHGALVCAALLAFVSGCSVIHLGHSSPSDDMTAATIDAKPTGKKGHEKQADAAALDPLSEAQLRAQEQPSEPWWPYQVATLEAKAGRSAEAEASLRAAVARDSGYAPALTALSRCPTTIVRRCSPGWRSTKPHSAATQTRARPRRRCRATRRRA